MNYKLTIEMYERKTNKLVHSYTSKFSTKLEAYINAVELANALSSDYHYYKYKVEEVQ